MLSTSQLLVYLGLGKLQLQAWYCLCLVVALSRQKGGHVLCVQDVKALDLVEKVLQFSVSLLGNTHTLQATEHIYKQICYMRTSTSCFKTVYASGQASGDGLCQQTLTQLALHS